MTSFIELAVCDGIIRDPVAAAKEVGEVLGHYVLDNARLNRVYQAAVRHLLQPDKITLESLRRAVKEAEG